MNMNCYLAIYGNQKLWSRAIFFSRLTAYVLHLVLLSVQVVER